MRSSWKVVSAMLFIIFILLTFGQLSVVYSDSSSVSDKALAYIQNVLPLDMGCYTITPRGIYEPPKIANTTYRTESISFILNSSGSLLAANCVFHDGVHYACSLQVLSGSPISDRSYADLAEVTRSILEKHQVQTGVDTTKLTRMLDMVDSTTRLQIMTWGNIKLVVTHTGLATGLKMENVSLHVDPTTMVGITSFYWALVFNGTEKMFFFIDFANGTFHSLYDEHMVGEIDTSGSNIIVSSLDNNTVSNTLVSTPPLDTTPPRISGVSIENKTYISNEIPLEFNIDENISKITYSLDGQANVTIAGNTTITGLSSGAHNLTIYATDYAGNVGASETIPFSVAQETESQPEPQPFPTVSVAAALVSVIVFFVGLKFFFKKHNLK